MLTPLTRAKFEQLIPVIATAPQYTYFWGKFNDFLRRLLISVIAMVVILVLSQVFGAGVQALMLLLGVIGGLYWFWGPVYLASMRNATYRRLPYSGFLQGEVLDIFVTEDLIGEEETVNNRGELVVIENRERRINLEIGDETGFVTEIQAPLRRIHKAIKPGDTAELLVLSRQSDLGQIAKITDAYLPQHNLWVGEYPYLRRDFFAQVSRELEQQADYNANRRTANPRRRRR